MPLMFTVQLSSFLGKFDRPVKSSPISSASSYVVLQFISFGFLFDDSFCCCFHCYSYQTTVVFSNWHGMALQHIERDASHCCCMMFFIIVCSSCVQFSSCTFIRASPKGYWGIVQHHADSIQNKAGEKTTDQPSEYCNVC